MYVKNSNIFNQVAKSIRQHAREILNYQKHGGLYYYVKDVIGKRSSHGGIAKVKRNSSC